MCGSLTSTRPLAFLGMTTFWMLLVAPSLTSTLAESQSTMIPVTRPMLAQILSATPDRDGSSLMTASSPLLSAPGSNGPPRHAVASAVSANRRSPPSIPDGDDLRADVEDLPGDGPVQVSGRWPCTCHGGRGPLVCMPVPARQLQAFRDRPWQIVATRRRLRVRRACRACRRSRARRSRAWNWSCPGRHVFPEQGRSPPAGWKTAALSSRRLAMCRVLARVAPGHRSQHTPAGFTGTPASPRAIARRESHSDVRHCLVIERSSSGFIDLLSVKSDRDSYAESETACDRRSTYMATTCGALRWVMKHARSVVGTVKL